MRDKNASRQGKTTQGELEARKSSHSLYPIVPFPPPQI